MCNVDLMPRVYAWQVYYVWVSGGNTPNAASECRCMHYAKSVMLCRFVHAQQLEAMNVSLTFHMAMGLWPRPPACIPLQLSRHLECRLADAEGVANVRHWLQLIGSCATLL